MKKVFTNLFLLASLFVAGNLTAQVFFTETFAGGLPAGWTTTDGSNQGVLWEYCAMDSTCANLFGLDEPKTATFNNGLMLMNSDAYFDTTATGTPTTLPTNHLSRLTTSAINCTGKPKVYLTMEMYFLVFAATSTANLRVSTDGTNWTNFTIPYALTNVPLDDGNTGKVTDNPVKPLINISSVAGNSPTVYIQWEFNGNWDYWWWLDDIKLTTIDPTPAVNMKISSFFYPLTHYETPDFAISKDTFGFSCNVTNSGTDQTALIVKAQVYNEAGNVLLFQDSLITDGLIGGLDSQFIFDKRFAPELSAGKYSVRYNCYVPGLVDAVPADNAAKQLFAVSNNGRWARDGGTALTYTRPATISADGWATVSLFHMLGGVNDKFHIRDVEWRGGKTGGMDGQTAAVYILEINDAVVGPDWSGFDPTGLQTDDNNAFSWVGNLFYEYLDTTTGNTPLIRYGVTSWPDETPGVNIAQGKRYLVAVSWEGASKDISMGFVTNIPYTNVNTFIYNAPTWFSGFSGAEYTASTRLYVFLGEAGMVITDESPLPESALSIFPNPTSDQLNLALNFEKPTSVTITLAAINGQVISVEDKEGLTSETINYDISSYPAGTYLARIATPEGTKTKEFVVIR